VQFAMKPATGGVPLAVAAALVGYAIFLFAPQVLNDGDTFWHIRTGEWILSHHAVPWVDSFSYTFTGKPWLAHEWLSEVLLAVAYRGLGWDGIVVLCGAATALAFGMMAIHLSRWTDRLPAALLLFIGAACVGPSLLARPHILALPMLELWTAGLLIARSQGRAPSLWLLPVMVIWANLHGSFVFGLGLALALGLEAVSEAAGNWRPVVRGWGIFVVAAIVVTLATPYGWRGLAFPFELMRMKQLSNIGEWQPMNFHSVQPLEIGLMAVLYVSWTRGVRVPEVRALILLGLLFLALEHTRHQMLAGVVGALLLAEPIGRAFASEAAVRRGRPWVWAAGGLLVVLALTGLRVERPEVRKDEIAGALAHVPGDVLRAPVFNEYGLGPNLIFDGVRPFIDSRAELYGDDFLVSYSGIMRPDREAFLRMADRYRVRWTILTPASPLVDMLDNLLGWRRIYTDQGVVVHVRTASGGSNQN